MIGICSFGSTGSGAITDLLKEYKNTTVIDKKEFVLTYFPDGFEDLEFHLMKQKAKNFSSDIAIKRFVDYTKAVCHNEKSFYYKLTNGHFNEIIDDYVKKITQIKYKGRWIYDDVVFKSNIDKLIYAIKKKFNCLEKFTLRDVYYSLEPDDFYIETEKILKKIYNYNESDSLFILDQPFPANNPINSMKLFGKDSKAIIVYRDPRDLYCIATGYGKLKSRYLPQDNVYDFINFYKKQYEYRFNRKDILYVQFEDLLYKYEETVKKIEKFCGLKEKDHINKYKYFNPDVSIKNTQLFIKNKVDKKEIKVIEKNMKNYLYPFNKRVYKCLNKTICE